MTFVIQRAMVRKILGLLLSFAFLVVLLELMLSTFDPLGMGYFNDEAYLAHQRQHNPCGYTFLPGKYTLRHWEFNVLDDGTRLVPASHSAEKEVVFIGDSVTFSYGVNDAQTWVNLVAESFPSIRVVNARKPGYNTTNARCLLATYPDADLIVYTTISNDLWNMSAQVDENSSASLNPPRKSYLELYITHSLQLLRPTDPDESARIDMNIGDMPRVLDDLDAITADPRMLLISFDDVYGQKLSECYDVHLIDWYTEVISRIDGHPNVVGNQRIAEQMIPIVQRVLAKRT